MDTIYKIIFFLVLAAGILLIVYSKQPQLLTPVGVSIILGYCLSVVLIEAISYKLFPVPGGSHWKQRRGMMALCIGVSGIGLFYLLKATA